ncbi:3-deoxy-7-phosphoheptulonate synthase [Lamprobacter modestohalophilus]|uniref:3-deoxy-7-phosphoheptulonate synthase n=1 Tax=Lamprobacter modestohalophilus TaxID=1064514 RepID=UPI002ADEE391|nr:3-deoxy-7-phosphoheptulonate synthase [Lamprobacter modestohalophilus]MCF8003839.1 3-deoxy-7-phosphoheptulonate synthase [Chromatiaceae bacterium]MEA1048464.1 3-deoxy-7-phosphoheptulonate synthase [Lamprobacter modestohalophilus]
MRYETDDLRIRAIKQVIAPKDLHAEFPITEAAAATVHETRKAIQHILHGEDDRLLVVVGPCSVHDPAAALEYAQQLASVRDQVSDQLLIVMRVYFEKPRTTVGWKGLINDPNLDGSFEINKGLGLARRLLIDLNDQGMPAGTEFLDLISPQYIADLVSWGAIGARTTESQGHRELASGLSCPVGFKNATDGSVKVAIDAIHAAARPHVFMSLTKEGHSAIFTTTGNEDTHIILRGGSRPNYDTESVDIAATAIQDSGLVPKIMIDFSHANSRKQPDKQLRVAEDVAGQIARGEARIYGAMIESNLIGGRQNLTAAGELVYGQSITDACLAWEQTAPMLMQLAEAAERRRARR